MCDQRVFFVSVSGWGREEHEARESKLDKRRSAIFTRSADRDHGRRRKKGGRGRRGRGKKVEDKEAGAGKTVLQTVGVRPSQSNQNRRYSVKHLTEGRVDVRGRPGKKSGSAGGSRGH